MSRYKLTDEFSLDASGIKPTADGYLACNARVARTGIQVYKGYEVGRPDMETVKIYRPPEEVFKRDAMKSFAHRPITYLHPPETVGSRNWKQYAIGHTGEDVVRDGDFVRVPMLLMDAAAIEAYQKDGVKELSMGYSTELKWKPGQTRDGQSYDAIQTDIRGNHLAVVPVARGGELLRIGDKKAKSDWDEDDDDDGDQDTDDAAPFFFDREFSAEQRKNAAEEGAALPDGSFPIRNKSDLANARQALGRAKDRGKVISHIKKRAKALGENLPENWPNDSASEPQLSFMERTRTMRTLTIDGVPIELDDQSAAFLQNHLKRLSDVIQDQKGKLDKSKADEEEEEEEETRAQDAIRQALDARDGEIAALKKQVESAKITPADLNRMVKDRAAVIGGARQLLGDRSVKDDDERSDADLRRVALSKTFSDEELKTMSDAAVAAAFMATIRAVKSSGGSQTRQPNYGANDALKHAIADANSRPGYTGDALEEAKRVRDEAFAELEKRSASAWRGNGRAVQGNNAA